MRNAIAICLVLCIAAIGLAGERLIVLHKGKHYLVELEDSMLVPVVKTNAKEGGDEPKPNPTPVPSQLSSQIAIWTAETKAKPETIKALVLATQAIRRQVESGKTAALDVWAGKKAFSGAYAVIVKAQGEDDKWAKWLKSHREEVIRQTQDKGNGLNSKEEVAKLLADTEAGLQAHLDGSGLLDRIDRDTVIRLFTLALQLKGGGLDVDTVLAIIDALRG